MQSIQVKVTRDSMGDLTKNLPKCHTAKFPTLLDTVPKPDKGKDKGKATMAEQSKGTAVTRATH